MKNESPNEKDERLAVNGVSPETETEKQTQTVKPQPDSQFAPAPLLGVTDVVSFAIYDKEIECAKIMIKANKVGNIAILERGLNRLIDKLSESDPLFVNKSFRIRADHFDNAIYSK